MNWIKKAVVSLLNRDDGTYPTTQVAANDVAVEAFRFSPYGIASHPPLDSLAIVLNGNCHAGDPIAMICSPEIRAKDLRPGEVVFENPVERTEIRFPEGGNIDMKTGPDGSLTLSVPAGDAIIDVSGAITITSPTVNITGNVNVTGTITASVDVLAGPLNTSLISHVHAITSGSSAGSTAPPT